MAILTMPICHCTVGTGQGNYARKINKKASRFEKKKENYFYLQVTQSYIEYPKEPTKQ